MSILEQRLNDFADERIGFGDLRTTVQQLAGAEDAAGSELMLVLSRAHESSVISSEQCHDLLTCVVNAEPLDVTNAETAADEDATQTFLSTTGTTVTAVGVGSVIKDRFLLMEKLGEGGMGVVYQARDGVRVEAKDRDPVVAIKVLNEDFKDHPESFIALQRECSKAQRLAHPNIATVYDFDHTGGVAFMTMELLRGKPFNVFLREDLPDGGLAFEDAWPMIKGLGDALAYAHRNKLVHSDFKPANAFLCDNGDIKVIDFGIARAVRRPGDTQFTVFDAATLGALTPAYASPEMLEGEDPDPRDDIYAFAVVIYLMLTSEHPFDRNPANIAAAMNKRPAPIPGLTRRQNAALDQALAFSREERTRDVETLLAELGGEAETARSVARQQKLIAALGVGFLAMTAAVIYLLVK